MKEGSYNDEKYSRDLSHLRSSWLAGKRQKTFRDRYDDIKWNDEPDPEVAKLIRKGRAKKSTATEQLFIKETVNAARTPVLERKGVAGEKTFQHVS